MEPGPHVQGGSEVVADNIPLWPKTLWPPYSPVGNPLDYSFWVHVESKACCVRHPNINALKDSVSLHCNAMSKDYMKKTCKNLRPRLEAISAANGSYIDD